MYDIQVFGAGTGIEEAQAAQGPVLSGWMGMGPRVTEFEAKMTERLQRPFLLTNNGSNALHLAVKLLDLPRGSKIIVPSFTWASCDTPYF